LANVLNLLVKKRSEIFLKRYETCFLYLEMKNIKNSLYLWYYCWMSRHVVDCS